ncbi:copper resistance protein CopC [Microbacterium sp. CFBP9034]|nr:copper resistance protein CopC [Microbacterium sp. CFBP9034]MDY0909513.1 copper resistance protein CopC [Microbacterium sp. CFBP9034]
MTELGAAGDYRVLWRAVADNGHPISSEYSFTYAPVEGLQQALKLL